MFRVKIYIERGGYSPIKELLDDLDKKAKADKSARIRLKTIYRHFDALREYGSRVGMPYARHIEDDIWELRPLNDRFFYAYWKDNEFVVLHQYVKKSGKTPQREIEQAKRNLTDFLERSKKHDEENR
jgi:phage-related protein